MPILGILGFCIEDVKLYLQTQKVNNALPKRNENFLNLFKAFRISAWTSRRDAQGLTVGFRM